MGAFKCTKDKMLWVVNRAQSLSCLDVMKKKKSMYRNSANIQTSSHLFRIITKGT